jgi:hypothetical protein
MRSFYFDILCTVFVFLFHLGGSTISSVDMMHVLLKDDDDSQTETARVAVVAEGTSRWEEQTGNGHDDNSTQQLK